MRLNCSIDEIERLAPHEAKELLDKDTESEFQLPDVGQPREGRYPCMDYEIVKGTIEDKLITGGEGAIEFYSKAQRLVKDEKAAQVFKRLVAMEDTHLHRLSFSRRFQSSAIRDDHSTGALHRQTLFPSSQILIPEANCVVSGRKVLMNNLNAPDIRYLFLQSLQNTILYSHQWYRTPAA